MKAVVVGWRRRPRDSEVGAGAGRCWKGTVHSAKAVAVLAAKGLVLWPAKVDCGLFDVDSVTSETNCA